MIISLFHYFSKRSLLEASALRNILLLSLVYKYTWTWLSQSICTYIVPISTPKDTSERLLLCCIYCTIFCRDDRWIGPSSSSAIAIAIAAGSEGATPIKITATHVYMHHTYVGTSPESLVSSQAEDTGTILYDMRWWITNYTPNRHRASNLNPLTSTHPKKKIQSKTRTQLTSARGRGINQRTTLQ